MADIGDTKTAEYNVKVQYGDIGTVESDKRNLFVEGIDNTGLATATYGVKGSKVCSC